MKKLIYILLFLIPFMGLAQQDLILASIQQANACTPDPNQQYIESSAISDPNCNESNTIAGWTGNAGTIDLATTTDSFEGTYAMIGTMNTGATAAYMQRTITATSGDTFNVMVRIKTTQSTGNTGFTAWTNVSSGGPASDYIEPGDGWVLKTYSITVSGNFIIRGYASTGGSGAIGDNLIMDVLSIIETTP